MNDEIIFDTLYTQKEYQALPEHVQAECVKVQWFTNLLDGPTMLLEDERTVGKVIWRGACGYLYDARGDGGLYAHKSQHPASMSANRLVVHHGYRNKGAVDDVLDPLFADQVRCVDRRYAMLGGEQQFWPMNTDSKLREGDHALPSWRNHTVGTYYTKKLTMVKPYMADASLEATDRMHQLLRMYYPRVVHPLGFAWVSEVRYNPRKKRVEAKVLNERWLPVAQPGLDDESIMMRVSRSRIVQWDATMLQRPQHVTGETFLLMHATGYENKGKNSVQRYVADEEGKAAYLDWFNRYSASKVSDPNILRLQSSFQWQASEQRWYITLEIGTVREDQLPAYLKEQREQLDALLAHQRGS